MARKKAVARKPANKNDQILTLLRGLDKKFTGKFEGLSKDVEGLDKKFTGKFEGLSKDVEGLDKKFTGKFEGLSKDVEGLSRDFDGLNKNVEGLSRDFDGLSKNVEGLSRDFDGLSKKFEGLDRKVDKIAQEAKDFREHHLKFEAETKRRFDAVEIKIIGFKDEILSVVDVTRKEYDETRQERIMTGLALDRQQQELEALKLSDGKQNQALEHLDTRVTTLEMNKAA